MTYSIFDKIYFPLTTGIYSISFKGTDKVYIGSASRKSNIKSCNGFYNRWSKHIYNLRKNKTNTHLQRAYNKYGEENMYFSILEECDSKICILKEQFYMNKYNSYENGLNSRPKAENNSGYKQSDIQKNKIISKYKEIRKSYLNEIISLYSEDKTTREISKILNISRGVIGRIFKENNLKSKSLSDYKKIPIYQYSLRGDMIKLWESSASISKEIGINTNSIRLVLEGKCTQSKGYYFNKNRLTNEEVIQNIMKIKSENKKRKLHSSYIKYCNIQQIDKNGNTIKIWENLSDILRFLRIKNRKYITNSIKNRTEYKGFYWNMK